MSQACVFIRDLMTGARRVVQKDGAVDLGMIMPQVDDSRQQPKSLAHKMLAAHLDGSAYCIHCDNKCTDDEQLHCAACGRHR